MEELIQRLKEELEDVKEHDADFCNVTVEDSEAIIEYLEQFKEIVKSL